MDKNLHIKAAGLITDNFLELEEFGIALDRGYNWWTFSKNFNEKEAFILNTNGDLKSVPVTTEAEIVPVILFDNYTESDYIVGDRFVLKGLQFLIIDCKHAICLSSIGSSAFADEQTAETLLEHHIPINDIDNSDILSILQDWFKTFIQGSTVPYSSKIPPVIDIYKIISTGDGGWFVVNQNNQEATFCTKVFLHYSDAEDYIHRWFEKHPVPEEDIKAYNDHRARYYEHVHSLI